MASSPPRWRCRNIRCPTAPASVNPLPMHASKDPLHGITLEKILEQLVAHHGWAGMAERVNINCFKFEPSITSSLRFLRKTPWARAKVEQLYREMVGNG